MFEKSRFHKVVDCLKKCQNFKNNENSNVFLNDFLACFCFLMFFQKNWRNLTNIEFILDFLTMKSTIICIEKQYRYILVIYIQKSHCFYQKLLVFLNLSIFDDFFHYKNLLFSSNFKEILNKYLKKFIFDISKLKI